MTSARVDGVLAQDHYRLEGATNGDNFPTKLSSVESVQISLRDSTVTSGTANTVTWTSTSGRITLAITGYSTAGTAYVTVFGRL